MGRPLQSLFDEYGESHRNPANVMVHWFAVPLIYFSIIGLLASLPVPAIRYLDNYLWAWIAIGAVWFYYFRHSAILSIAMVTFSALCLSVAHWTATNAPWPLWAVCLGVFAAGWAAQFIGHGIEGKKPSFLKDLQFLLIGPAWLFAKAFRKLGISY